MEEKNHANAPEQNKLKSKKRKKIALRNSNQTKILMRPES